jgi:hypothetical protein
MSLIPFLSTTGAVMAFDRMHPFLYYAMHFLISTYDPKVWDIAGPQVVTKSVMAWSNLHPFMVRWIPEHKAGKIDDKISFFGISNFAFDCTGELDLPNEPIGSPAISVFTDRYAFYAYPWWIRPRMDTTDLEQYRKDIEERAYAYHYVNQMVRETNSKIKKGIYLFDLLQRACLFECDHDDLDINIVELLDKK